MNSSRCTHQRPSPHLSGAQEDSFSSTPATRAVTCGGGSDDCAGSPPPLRISQGTPQPSFNDENYDILLPVIPDDFNDDYLFSEGSCGRKRNVGLTFRPRKLAPPLQQDFIFIDKASCVAQRVLMPLLDAPEDRGAASLSIRARKRGCNPVLDTCS